MSLVAEFLSGAHRFFPNIITLTLLTIGLFLGKANWVLIGLGGVVVAITVLTIQAIFFGLAPGDLKNIIPGSEVIAACSLLPASHGQYYTAPSIWVALASFYVTYIIVNAANIYTTKPTKLPNSAIPVQQRKGMGLISMVATALLLIMLFIGRWVTGCETIFGVIGGVIAGVGIGYGWWTLLNACGADYYPDIHGVMIGLNPGRLHTSPVACAPK